MEAQDVEWSKYWIRSDSEVGSESELHTPAREEGESGVDGEPIDSEAAVDSDPAMPPSFRAQRYLLREDRINKLTAFNPLIKPMLHQYARVMRKRIDETGDEEMQEDFFRASKTIFKAEAFFRAGLKLWADDEESYFAPEQLELDLRTTARSLLDEIERGGELPEYI